MPFFFFYGGLRRATSTSIFDMVKRGIWGIFEIMLGGYNYSWSDVHFGSQVKSLEIWIEILGGEVFFGERLISSLAMVLNPVVFSNAKECSCNFFLEEVEASEEFKNWFLLVEISLRQNLGAVWLKGHKNI